MGIALKIAQALKNKGMNQKELADKLGKRPSEISKWLAGNHNFTHDTLFDIQTILDIRLLDTEMENTDDFIRIEPVRMEYKDKKSSVFPVSRRTFYSYNDSNKGYCGSFS